MELSNTGMCKTILRFTTDIKFGSIMNDDNEPTRIVCVGFDILIGVRIDIGENRNLRYRKVTTPPINKISTTPKVMIIHTLNVSESKHIAIPKVKNMKRRQKGIKPRQKNEVLIK